MIRYLASVITFLCLALSAGTSCAYNSLSLNDKDGVQIILINFNSGLTMLIDESEVSVSGLNASDESFTLSYPLKEIGGWNFSEDVADEIHGDKVLAVETVHMDSPLTVTLIADGVRISGLPAESIISVCNPSGRVTYSDATTESALTIPATSLSRGVNVLTVNDRSIKFTVNQQ